MNGVIGIQGLSAIAHTTFNSSLTLLRLKVAVKKMPQNRQYTMIPENGNPDTFQIAASSSNISDGPGVRTWKYFETRGQHQQSLAKYTFTCFIHYTHTLLKLNSKYRIIKPKNLQRYPITVFWHKDSKMAGSKPLIQEADPCITKQ